MPERLGDYRPRLLISWSWVRVIAEGLSWPLLCLMSATRPSQSGLSTIARTDNAPTETPDNDEISVLSEFRAYPAKSPEDRRCRRGCGSRLTVAAPVQSRRMSTSIP